MGIRQKVWIENSEQFNLSNLCKYISEFELLKNQGYIDANTEFESHIWIFKIRGERTNLIFFNEIELKSISKELGISEDIIDSGMKSFMLNLIENTSAPNVLENIVAIKSLLKRRLAKDKSIFTIKAYNICKKFDIFMCDISAEYLEVIFEYAVEVNYKTRQIASFASIFKFDEIIEYFYRENKNNKEILLKWYPLIVWWKLTSIIPLRPSELINMNRNCIEKNNDYYFITVKRSIGKTSNYKLGNTSIEENCYYDDRINIDKKMYIFLKKYNDDVGNVEGEFIFSKELYTSFNRIKQSLNKNKFKVNDLVFLLDSFYKNIVQNKYGYIIYERTEKTFEQLNEKDIERLTLYDARHIAIINAIFLGYDIQTVQRLARHEDINTTYGYFQHQHEYAKSFALAFSKKMLHKNDIKKIPLIQKARNNNRGNLIVNSVLHSNDKTYINRKNFESYGGYCEYNTNNDISYCMKFLPTHSLCPHFIPYNEDAQIDETEKKLSKCIQVLCDIVKEKEKIVNFNGRISIQRDVMLDNTYKLAQLLVKKEN